MVDVLGAVVGVNALNHEGKRLDEPFEYGEQELSEMASTVPTNWNWVTSIDRVDVGDALGAVLVALVDVSIRT